jgi:autotransporter-associated beta strand protein
MKRPILQRVDLLCHLLLISFFVTVAAHTSRAAINVVSYWRLGESDSGAAAGATAANTTDSVGAMNLRFQGNARYANDVAATAATHIGSLLSVNFTNSAYATNAIVSTAQDNFGIECWAKPTALGGGQIIAYNGVTGGAGSGGWGIIIAADGTYQGLFGGITTIGTSVATANVWTHLALVRNGGTTTLYVNGVAAGTSAAGPAFPQGNFALGAPPQSPTSQFFTGLIDEVRVFTFAAGQFSTSDLLLNQFRTWMWTGPDNDLWSNTNDWTRAGDGAHGLPASGDTVNSTSGHSVRSYDDANAMSLDSVNLLSTSDPSYHLYLNINSGGTGARTLTFTGAGVRDVIAPDSRYALIHLNAGNSSTVRGGSFIIFANSASACTPDSLSPIQYQLDGAPGLFMQGGLYHSYIPGEISFTGNSSAGNGVFTLSAGTTIHTVDGDYASLGGIVSFTGNSSGGNASFYMGGVTQNGVRTVANLRIADLSSAGTTVGEVSGSGQITLGSKSLTVGSRNTDMSFTGLITGAGGSIIKVGTGALVLAGTNTYTGGTTVSNGSIVLNNNAALPSTAPLAINGGILDLRGFNGSIGALSGTGGTIENRAAGLWTLSIGNGGNGGGTFAGTIVDHITSGGTVGLTVNGGVQTLTGANTYTGPTTINAGTLIVNGSLGATPVTVAPGATLVVNGTISGPVTVNGLLSGSGVLNGPLTNNAGGKVLITGGSFTVNNVLVNNGTFVLRGGAGLLSGASFLNNGTFDVITAGSVSLADFVSPGTVLDGTALRIVSLVNTGTNVLVTINGYSDHSFQMQSSADLTPGSFANVGTTQSGITGSTLIFTDSGASSPQQFYRVFVNP